MTSRERFVATLRDGTLGCPPRFEREIRDDVVAAWREQGLPAGTDVNTHFGFDPWQIAGPYGSPLIRLFARPDLPHTPRSPGDIPKWEASFTLADRYDDDWDAKVAATRGHDWPLGLHAYRGLFLSFGVHDGQSLQDHVYFLIDYPDAVAAMMERLAEFTIALVEPALKQMDVDYLSLSEPIAGSNAPVVGPHTFARAVLPFYRAMVEMGRRAGLEIFLWESYGQVEVLLPVVLEAGFNCLWLGETGDAGTDYVRLRERYGPEIGLLGGIDARILSGSKREIEAEVRRIAEPLLASGRYIPMLSSRMRPVHSFEGIVARAPSPAIRSGSCLVEKRRARAPTPHGIWT
ncbi:MAG: hypothetical protein HYU66_25540 [Armatimonadetes bacterium]|nr:hypothetical protein [Armatimonadota bacterium]